MDFNKIDPITFEVITSSFEHITKIMGYTIQKVSMSPIIYDSMDFSNALFSPKCELIGQTTNCPVHLAAMHPCVQSSLDRYGIENLKNGDVIVLNDPYRGGTHIPDVTFTTPIFYKDQLIGFACNRGHWVDLGGGAPGGRMVNCSHIVQEGLRIPPVKLYSEGKLVTEIRDLMTSNSRIPQQVLGDIEAHRAALMIAKTHMIELVEKYGVDTLFTYMDAALDYTEMQSREAIREIPDGEYEAETYLDCNNVDPESKLIKAKMIVKEDTLHFDFTGTDIQTRGNVNYTAAGTLSSIYYALRFFIANDSPQNGGLYRPISAYLPEGTLVNAKWPACVYAGNCQTTESIADLVWKLIDQAIPGIVPGAPYGDSNGFHIAGVDYDKGTSFAFIDLPCGGWGGFDGGDGMNTTYCRHGNCMDLDIEQAEVLYPVCFERREFIQDSGGPGKFRGGLSVREGFQFFAPVEIAHTTSRTKKGPAGMSSGGNGRPGRSLKNFERENQEVVSGWEESGNWKIASFSNKNFLPGETWTVEAQGGGGWGDPKERDIERIRQDLEDEYISLKVAKKIYGYDREKADD